MTSDAANVPADSGAREALVERIANALRKSPNAAWLVLPGPTDIAPSFARAVLPVADAEVAAAVSEAQAELTEADRSAGEWMHRAAEAEASLKGIASLASEWDSYADSNPDSGSDFSQAATELRERLAQVGPVTTCRTEVERLEQGIRALADDLEKFAVEGEVSSGIASGWRGGVKLAAHNVRALLSPSPAATTGEARASGNRAHARRICNVCWFEDHRRCRGGSCACECETALPAPVSSDSTGIPTSDADPAFDAEDSRISAPVSSGEAATGEAVQS